MVTAVWTNCKSKNSAGPLKSDKGFPTVTVPWVEEVPFGGTVYISSKLTNGLGQEDKKVVYPLRHEYKNRYSAKRSTNPRSLKNQRGYYQLFCSLFFYCSFLLNFS